MSDAILAHDSESQSSDYKIDEFLAIACTSRAHALLHLKEANNNVLAAVNQHFDKCNIDEHRNSVEPQRRNREMNNNNNMMMMGSQQQQQHYNNNSQTRKSNNKDVEVIVLDDSDDDQPSPPITRNTTNNTNTTKVNAFTIMMQSAGHKNFASNNTNIKNNSSSTHSSGSPKTHQQPATVVQQPPNENQRDQDQPPQRERQILSTDAAIFSASDHQQRQNYVHELRQQRLQQQDQPPQQERERLAPKQPVVNFANFATDHQQHQNNMNVHQLQQQQKDLILEQQRLQQQHLIQQQDQPLAQEDSSNSSASSSPSASDDDNNNNNDDEFRKLLREFDGDDTEDAAVPDQQEQPQAQAPAPAPAQLVPQPAVARRPAVNNPRVIDEFKSLVVIPFRNAREDKTAFYSVLPRALVPGWTPDQHERALIQRASGRLSGSGLECLREQSAKVDALIMRNFVSPVEPDTCGCLLQAANFVTNPNLKENFIQGAITNESLRLIAPYSHHQKTFDTIRVDPLDSSSEIVSYRLKDRAFTDAYGDFEPPSQADPNMTFGFGSVFIPETSAYFHIPPDVVSNGTVNQYLEHQLKGTSLSHRLEGVQVSVAGRIRQHTGGSRCTRGSPIIVESKQNFNDGPDRKKHGFHQLFVRLSFIDHSGAALPNSVTLDLSTFGDNRDQIWKRRFLIETVSRCTSFERNQQIKTELPTFENLYRELLTPAAIFNIAKDIQAKSAKEIFDFYGQELVRINTDVRPVPTRPPGITVDLYPHQRRTVAFMLDRERNGVQQFVHSDPIPLPRGAIITENGIQVPRGKYTHYRFHVNSAFGAFLATPIGSAADQECMTNGKHRGGILADQVGMGKTLSILSLITLNPAPYETHYTRDADTPLRATLPADDNLDAAARHFKDNLSTKLKIRATLVLAPVSLVGQWEEEIRKRAPNMKIVRFHGLEKKRATYASIAAADIVITTFETYKLTLEKESIYFKRFVGFNDPIAGHLIRRKAEQNDDYHNNIQCYNVTSFVNALYKLEKDVVKKGNRPTADTVFLSRLHFHRIVADEFHKNGGLNSIHNKLVDSNSLWLVSGTPLDAPIGDFMKRLGVMDYSFVDSDRLRRAVDSADHAFATECSGRNLIDFLFRHRGRDDTSERPRYIWDGDVERMKLYKPPATIACNVARLAFLSQYMIRNTVDTCPELADVAVTQRIVTVKHNEKEAAKYKEALENVRAELQGLRARGALQTRILYVLTLLNNLRRAAVDPFGVTINVRDALAVGNGAQFENENDRRNIHLVPVNIFAHLVFPNDFPNTAAVNADGAPVNATDRAFTHVKSVTQSGSLKEELAGMLKDPPELEACIICLENLAQPTAVSCGHVFCRDCILQWIQRGNAANCPACRRDSLGDNKKKSLLTFPPPPQEEKQPVKQEKVNEDEADPFAARLPTKIKKVLEIINTGIAEDRTSKFLIFTSIPSVLTLVKEALSRAAIGSVIIDGSSTLNQRADRVKQFQEITNVSTRVCIVSSRVGNMGLTLTAANHLIMIEPASNIDVDTQILGRVKRLGQKRAVTCHRLLVEDSIEFPLYELVQARTVSLSAAGNAAAKKAVADTIMKLVYPDGQIPPAGRQQQENHQQHLEDMRRWQLQMEQELAQAALMNRGGDDDSDSDDDGDDDHVNRARAAAAGAAAAAAVAAARNNNNAVDANGLTEFERQQMAEIARWEREHGTT